MSNYDPRILIPQLNTLTEEVQRFSQTAIDVLNQAEYTQNCASERISQVRRWQSILSNQLDTDLAELHRTATEINQLISKSDTAILVAKRTLTEVEKEKAEAEQLHQHWTHELEKAIAWRAQAETRLEKAIIAYERASSNLESAKNALENARRRLRNCNNDRERKSCMMESIACSSAEGKYEQALEIFLLAEEELAAAKEDLRLAKARVQLCEKAVSLTTQAVKRAQFALDEALQGLSAAERSSESAESAHRATAKADITADDAKMERQSLKARVRKASELTEQARHSAHTASRVTDSAHCIATQGNNELEYRIQSLVRFNKADSLPVKLSN